MTKKSWQGKSVRTSITLNRSMYREVRDLMEKQGWGDNFSAFISDLVRERRSKMRRQKTLEAKQK